MYVYLFSTIGILLVCIATFNYINLSTARVTWEARGASIRRVLGATKAHLRNLFLTESLLVAVIAAVLAVFFCAGISQHEYFRSQAVRSLPYANG